MPDKVDQQRLAKERRELRREERREARRNRPGAPPEPPDTELPPEPEPPPSGGTTVGVPYDYNWQYADTENNSDFNRTINAGVMSQWGVALVIPSGPYPPGYRIGNGQPGGGYPPSGAQSNGTLPIRIQPPPSGNGLRLMFTTTATITVVNESDADGEFIWGLGVSYPSETDRPMYPWLGVNHVINSYAKMAPIIVPGKGSVCLTTIRMDVLDPDFADFTNWPEWQMVPNQENKLWPAITPTCVNPGKVPLKVKDVMCQGYAVPY